MILTGKAKDNFLDSNGKKEAWINIMLPIYQYALIIEWFDSVGIYIDIRIEFNDSFVLKTFDSYAEDDYVGNFSNRQEATIQAIKKANDLYNSRYENV